VTLESALRSQDTESEVARSAPTIVGFAPQIARVLAMQRSAGNAAVSRMLAGQRPSALARDPAAAPAAPATEGADPAGAPSPLADLAQRAGGAAGLRALLAADPALADQIVAYLQTTDDPALNELMAQAFAPAQEKTDGGRVAKEPTDDKLPLPAARPGRKTLAKGEMIWTLRAFTQSSARAEVEFKPDPAKVEAKAISYGQTVIQQLGGKAVYPENDPALHQPIEDPATGKRMDQFVRVENDPFYGAVWDQGAKKWTDENAPDWRTGSSTKGGVPVSAKMDDTPNEPEAREGKGDAMNAFETVPMVLETREPLGALKWGYTIKDEANAPIELTGGTDADCTDTPSADWGAAMDQYYAGKYAEILDDFDIGKADLKPDHTAKLDSIVTKMKANVVLKAQLGGAADLTGDANFNQALSLKRAQAAQAYLVGKGIDAARLEVQSYGADWARVEAAPGTSEGKNRRVQIWLH
jgi:outer membrane protein OmpA-like peptidoglycan-associated protein